MTDTQTARALFDAYASGDRAKAETLIARDFHFTSPLDNQLDRDGYFKICWPGAGTFSNFKFIHTAESQPTENGTRVFVVYEAQRGDGKAFRNCEVLTVRSGQITNVEVYFGWNVPHDLAQGQHKDPK